MSRFLADGTNNVAGLMAGIAALEAIKDPLSRDVIVTTDSQSVIGVMLHDWKTKANVTLVRRAIELADECGRFSIHHGHSGIAHKLALKLEVIVERLVAPIETPSASVLQLLHHRAGHKYPLEHDPKPVDGPNPLQIQQRGRIGDRLSHSVLPLGQLRLKREYLVAAQRQKKPHPRHSRQLSCTA